MRVRRSLLNFATLLLFTAVTMAVALFASPWLEGWLGRERFGAYRVLLDAYGYLTLLELGLGGALAPLLARAIGRGDERDLRATLGVGARAYLAVSVLTVAVGLALVPLVPGLASGLTAAAVGDLRRAWVVGLAGFLALGLVPFRAILEARQLGYRVNLVMAGQSLLTTALALTLARLGWGITGQAIAYAAGTWAGALALAADVLRAQPGLLRPGRSSGADRSAIRAVWALSLPTLLINLSGRVGLMTDNLVIGALLGAGPVTTLFFAQRLAVLAQGILQGIGNATWAALADLHARGEHATFNRRFVELCGLVAVLSVAALAPIAAFNRSFVALWMGPAFPYGGDLVVSLAALNAYLLAQLSLWAWCFGGTGRAPRLVPVSVATAAVNLAASLALTRRLGLPGPLLGTTFASVAVGTWWLACLLRESFGTPLPALARATVPPLAFGSLYAFGLQRLAREHPPQSWAALVLAMALSASLVLCLGVASHLRDREGRALWRARLRGLWPTCPVEEPAAFCPEV